MKKLLILITLLFSASASAQYMHWSSRHGPYRTSSDLIVPLIIGGAIGYGISRSQQYPNTVIIQQPSVTVENNMECSAWKETQQPDGTIKRERICYQR
jgi:hypothetical protein